MSCEFCKYMNEECPGESCPLHHFPKGIDQFPDFEVVCYVFGMQGFLAMLDLVHNEDMGAAIQSMIYEARCRKADPILGIFGILEETKSEFHKLYSEFQIFLMDQISRNPSDSLKLRRKLDNMKVQFYALANSKEIQVLKNRIALLEANNEELSRELCNCKRRFDAEQCGPEVKQLCKGKDELGPKKVDVGNQEEIGLEKVEVGNQEAIGPENVDVRITEVKEVTKVSQTKKLKQLPETVVDLGPPTDWVIVNVENKEDFSVIYALVPGLSREELNVEYSRGHLVISGKPKEPNNPWGITAFKKQVILPRLELYPEGTLAALNPRGTLVVRIPYATA